MLTLLFLIMTTAAASAQVPQLIKDIFPGSISSSSSNLTNVNGTLFFSANDGTSGTELWQSDGTLAGTVLVKDIRPGSSSSFASNLTNVNGTLFFTANDGTNGTELWQSDGTLAGTVLVKDIRPGSSSSFVSNLTNFNGTLFFTANDGTTGIELWQSDGTLAGTVLIKDILSGSSGSSPDMLTNVNGTFLFTANDGTNGTELWKSDGTLAGTVLVKDINPGSSGSGPENLTNVNGTLFFRAYDDTNGTELWKSDGTLAGTVLVKDIISGSSDSSPDMLTNVNGTLFFAADDGTNGRELWQSDGTLAGTVLVKDITPGSGSFPFNLTNVNGTLFFGANDGTNGAELWQSDGTTAGTVLVEDINPGASSSSPFNLTNVNGTLFFRANDGTNGAELWGFTPAHGFTLLAEEKIDLDHYESVEGDIHSNGDIEYDNGRPGTHTGNAAAVGDIEVARENTINGDLEAGGSIDIDDDATVGSSTPGASVAGETLPTFSFTCDGTDGSVLVDKDDEEDVAPGDYSVIRARKDADLNFSAGEYFIGTFKLDHKARLNVDVSSGVVIINVCDVIKLRKNAEIIITGGPSGALTINYSGTDKVELGKDGSFQGTLNAPDARVKLNSGTGFLGSICAKIIDVRKDARVRHHSIAGGVPKTVNSKGQTASVDDYRLEQNYPNPFNPSTKIQFALPAAGTAKLQIFDMLGRRVNTLVNAPLQAGSHAYGWNGRNSAGQTVAAGMYVYRLTVQSADGSAQFVKTQKMAFVK